MATPVWGAGSGAGSDNLWSTAANWTSDTKPVADDDVVFDNTVSANCTVDEATPELRSFTMGGTASGDYSGTITANNKIQMTGAFVCESGSTGNLTLAAAIDVDGDFTCDGGGTFNVGNHLLTIGGHVDNEDQTTWTHSGAGTKLTLTGTSKNWTWKTNKNISALNCSGSYTFLSGSALLYNGVSINSLVSTTGLVISSPMTLTGTLSGAIVLQSTIGTMSGTWSADTTCRHNVTINAAGTYGGDWTFKNVHVVVDRSFTIGADLVFTGNTTFDCEKTGRTYTVNNSGNNNLTFQGNLILAESAGTLNWTAGTGTITFSGTADQVVTIPSGWTDELEDIVIDKTAGSVKLVGDDLYCQSLDVQDGDFDLNGLTLDSAGSVTMAAGARFYNVDLASTAMDAGSTINIASGTLTLQGSA